MRWIAILLVAGCASRGGWMEGDEVNAEVRRVLASEPREGVGVDMPTATLHFGSGLDDERNALLAALVCAEAIHGGPAALHAVVAALDPAQPAGPRPDPAACRPPEVTEVWIRYPDCLCRARRWAFESSVLGYTVDVEDRRFGDDRSFTYRMRIRPSPALDEAWDGLLAAARSVVGYSRCSASTARPRSARSSCSSAFSPPFSASPCT